MSLVFKRPDSQYWYTRIDGEKKSTGKKNKRAAEKAAVKMRERERLEAERGPTLLEGFERLKERKVRANRSQVTMDKLDLKGGHIMRLFGTETRIATITLEDCERYIDQRESEGVGRHTVKIELSHLKQVLANEKRHGRYVRDPADIMPADALENAYVPRDRFLTEEEAKRLSDALPEHNRPLFWFYIYTGCRKSEAYRVYPEHVEDGHVHIPGTKTSDSRRTVPLHPSIRATVHSLAESASENKTALFPKKWDAEQTLKWACKRLGIPKCSPNDLRRTFATWLAQAGAGEMAVARMMGHGSSQMVRQVYVRWGKESLTRTVETMPSIDWDKIGTQPDHIDKPGDRKD